MQNVRGSGFHFKLARASYLWARACTLVLVLLGLTRVAQADTATTYLGVLVPRHSVKLTAPDATTVLSVSVHPGDRVDKNQVLAQLDTQGIEQVLLEAEATLDRVRAEERAAREALALARSKLKRRRRAPEAISQEEMESAQHEVGLAQAQLQAAQARVRQEQAHIEQLRFRLEQMTLRAPMAATVAVRRVDPGSDVAPGAVLLRLISANELLVRFAVPAQDRALLLVGEEVSIRLPPDDFPALGRITHIAPSLDTASRMIFVEATSEKLPGNLPVGSVVEVRLLDKSQ